MKNLRDETEASWFFGGAPLAGLVCVTFYVNSTYNVRGMACEFIL